MPTPIQNLSLILMQIQAEILDQELIDDPVGTTPLLEEQGYTERLSIQNHRLMVELESSQQFLVSGENFPYFEWSLTKNLLELHLPLRNTEETDLANSIPLLMSVYLVLYKRLFELNPNAARQEFPAYQKYVASLDLDASIDDFGILQKIANLEQAFNLQDLTDNESLSSPMTFLNSASSPKAELKPLPPVDLQVLEDQFKAGDKSIVKDYTFKAYILYQRLEAGTLPVFDDKTQAVIKSFLKEDAQRIIEDFKNPAKSLSTNQLLPTVVILNEFDLIFIRFRQFLATYGEYFAKEFLNIARLILGSAHIPKVQDSHLTLPVNMSVAINEFELSVAGPITQAFEAFAAKFKKINAAISDDLLLQQHREFEPFIFEHSYQLTTLILIMGPAAFKWMERMMAGSVLTLERNLKAIPMLPSSVLDFLAAYFTTHRDELSKPDSDQTWLEIMDKYKLIVDTHQDSLEDLEMSLATLKNLIKLPPQEFSHELSLFCIREIFKDLKLDIEQIDLNQFLERHRSGSLTRLLQARRLMANDPYKLIFDEMLKSDLASQPFTKFIEQEPIGQALKAHNEAIKKTLEAKGIDVKRALNYPIQSTFTLKSSGPDPQARLLNLSESFRVMASYFPKLQEQVDLLRPFPAEFSDKFKELGTALKNLSQIFAERYGENLDQRMARFLKDGNLMALAKLIGVLKTLTFSGNQFNPAFNEFANHIKIANGEMKIELTQYQRQTKQETKPPKTFSIRQWDKDDPRTFYLGNYVNCCLATDGNQFPALVQRRMDVAMFFHTVIDQDTDLPVSLAWLYFGENKLKPDELAVMANFFEIKAKYGKDKQAREQMVGELLNYTAQFAREVGASAFLVNHLSYGQIPDFKNYAQQSFHPLKVGGALDLAGDGVGVKEQYYLTSLDATEFHSIPLPAKLALKDEAVSSPSVGPSPEVEDQLSVSNSKHL